MSYDTNRRKENVEEPEAPLIPESVSTPVPSSAAPEEAKEIIIHKEEPNINVKPPVSASKNLKVLDDALASSASASISFCS